MGAHPNVVDFKGRSALMRAAELGHVQVIEILKKANADAKIRDTEGKGNQQSFFIQKYFKKIYF
jgi:ankyrin repeat protein